jgi:hypothetical protein
MQRRNDEDPSMSPHAPALSPQAAAAAPADASPQRSLTATDLLARVVAAGDLDTQRCTPPTWLWHGYLGPGKITLLTSQWKSGKTTLVSLLLARMQQGGQLAGLPVAAAKAFVISEESEAEWRRRFQHLGIQGSVHLLCRPFTAQPSMPQWLALIDAATALHDRQGCELVVIDSLASFLPAHSENSASALFECLTPLQRLATAGMCVLLPHHPKKGKTVAGQAARGCGALPGFVDIIIEMGHYTHPDDLDRRRRLIAFSRHDDTPRHLLIELQADGTDYVVLQTGLEAALGDSWPAVVNTLTEATSKLTRQEILENWPPDYSKPDSTTLWRWLSRALTQGIVRQEGTGRPRDPFRYWLPEREEMMRPDGGSPEALKAWHERCIAEMFANLKWTKAGQRAQEAPRPPEEDPTAATAVAAPDDFSPTRERGFDGTPSPDDISPTRERGFDGTPSLARRANVNGPAAIPLEPAPGPDTAAPVSPMPDPLPSPVAQPISPEAPVRLPYPYNIMNPADIPAEVWKQARPGQQNTL